MKENWRLTLWWPVVFGGLRFICLLVSFGRIETASYWLEKVKSDDKVLSEKLETIHKRIYKEKDALKLSKI